MKDLKISKELVSKVLGKEISQIQIVGNTLNYVIPNAESQEDDELAYIDLGLNINIYEFAFKCKEWAYKNFKIMLLSHCSGQCYINGDLSPLMLNWWNGTKSYQVESDTEVEAIFKACNWLLEQTK